MRFPSFLLTLALATSAIAALPARPAAAYAPAAHAAASAPSEAVVKQLYAIWQAASPRSVDDQLKAIGPLLTPEFHRLLHAAYNPVGTDGAIIEWDPFTASQEGTDRYVVGRAKRHQGYELVPVSLWGEGQKEPHGVVLRVVRMGGTWRIDDVAEHDRKFPVPSLKKWLKDALAAAKAKK